MRNTTDKSLRSLEKFTITYELNESWHAAKKAMRPSQKVLSPRHRQ